MAPDGDPVAHRNSAVVPDSRMVADDQGGTLGIAGGKSKRALPVQGDVVADNQLAAAVHPMKEHSGVQVLAIPGAIRFKVRLAKKDARDKIISRADRQKDAHERERKYARRGHRKVARRPSETAQQPIQPMIG
jgi:hypothetical protein